MGGRMLASVLLSLLVVASSAASQQPETRLASKASRQAPEPAQQVSLEIRNAPLQTVIDAIGEQAGLILVYTRSILPEQATVSLRVSKMPVMDALRQALQGTGVTATVSPSGHVVFSRASGMIVEQGVIVGKVTNAKTKQPVAGARIMIGSKAEASLTDHAGAFRLSLEPGEYQIVVRAVGMVRQMRSVTVMEGKTTIVEFSMEESASVLDEVIVTGTVAATQRREIPNPITVITAEDIERRGITRVEQLFRGEVPGVLALERGTDMYQGGGIGWSNGFEMGAMETSKVYVRGSSKLDGGTNPLKAYIDGVEVLDGAYLGTIDLSTIERIEIVTGPQAVTIYGSGAMGGVMQIFTKQGGGNASSDLSISGKYGILQNNFSPGLTPSHSQTLSWRGGNGPVLSFAANASHQYTGQWSPGVFSRRFGGALGMTHVRGGLVINGNFSVTLGRTGTVPSGTGLVFEVNRLNGHYLRASPQGLSQRVSTSTSQTASLNVDYRLSDVWQHHLTIGQNQAEFSSNPYAPSFRSASDSLYGRGISNGRRITASYNVTVSPHVQQLSSVITAGLTGSVARRSQSTGCTATPRSNALISCDDYVNQGLATVPLNDQSWGAFGRYRLGLFDRLYMTLGIRAEQSPAYGRSHKIDWTPSNGLTYVADIGSLSIKVMGSYGRATRAPDQSMRDAEMATRTNYEPLTYLWQLANPDLRPEYSRGPQYGIEMYYGTFGSVTFNRYDQMVTDLIQRIIVDSIPQTLISTGRESFGKQYQYNNVARIRQHGIEMTASAAIRSLSVKGVYSWSDSRVKSVNPRVSFTYTDGMVFQNLPSHTSSISAAYSLAGTSVSWTTNYIGASLRLWSNRLVYQEMWDYLRLRTYADRQVRPVNNPYTVPGYTKSDLSVRHHLTRAIGMTLDIQNVGNNFTSDVSELSPSLGRQTLLGVSLRYP